MKYITKYISALLSLILCFVYTYPAMIRQVQEKKPLDIQEQLDRIEQLEKDYKSGNYTKVNENSFCDFDLSKACADGVKYNEVSFLGTHNSYQKECVPARQKLFQDASTVTFGLVKAEKATFSADYLTDQLNLGIRSVELDVETVVTDGKISFVCSHAPVLDMPTHCYDFALALKEIKLWSDANPNHLPVTIIIEPKKVFIPDKNMHYFTCGYANELGEQAKAIFGDTLITPADMIGKHSSFKEMREADDWMTLSETRGHVMILLHDTTVTDKYIEQDTSIKTQAMFPMLRYDSRDKDYASFLLINKAKDIQVQAAEVLGKKLVIRTRSDNFGSYKESDSQIALNSGAQIVSTDYPPKADMSKAQRVVTFNGGYTVSIVK
ncbi:MAG TPA: hypothetical protein DCY15_01445 [Ruminococcaceae bacterium]|nr:hypothetical protein [Oscillospiraceae bacterium]